MRSRPDTVPPAARVVPHAWQGEREHLHEREQQHTAAAHTSTWDRCVDRDWHAMTQSLAASAYVAHNHAGLIPTATVREREAFSLFCCKHLHYSPCSTNAQQCTCQLLDGLWPKSACRNVNAQQTIHLNIQTNASVSLLRGIDVSGTHSPLVASFWPPPVLQDTNRTPAEANSSVRAWIE